MTPVGVRAIANYHKPQISKGRFSNAAVHPSPRRAIVRRRFRSSFGLRFISQRKVERKRDSEGVREKKEETQVKSCRVATRASACKLALITGDHSNAVSRCVNRQASFRFTVENRPGDDCQPRAASGSDSLGKKDYTRRNRPSARLFRPCFDEQSNRERERG